MKRHYKLFMDQVIKISLAIVSCIATLLLLSSSLYADNGKDFLSKDEREWLTENQSKITRAVETGYAPFVFIDSKDRPVGLANDYMLLLESKLGVHFKEKRFSKLNEIFDKLKSGEVQIVNAVIVSSGFGEVDIASKIPRDAMAGFISKPYRFDQLREVLRGGGG